MRLRRGCTVIREQNLWTPVVGILKQDLNNPFLGIFGCVPVSPNDDAIYTSASRPTLLNRLLLQNKIGSHGATRREPSRIEQRLKPRASPAHLLSSQKTRMRACKPKPHAGPTAPHGVISLSGFRTRLYTPTKARLMVQYGNKGLTESRVQSPILNKSCMHLL